MSGRAARAGRLLAVAIAGVAWPLAARAQQSGVAATVHNLSVSGPGEVKAAKETEVCKFCHIPHNALAPRPLWGHALSEVRHYQVPQVRGAGGTTAPAPQPDGSSRLCLSCHDGTVALGQLVQKRVAMAASERLAPGRRGYLGTDLSGAHPISVVVPDAAGDGDSGIDMGLKPLAAIQTHAQVRLDAQGKMQCTTCHDPHSDAYYQPHRVPHFWTMPTVTEVCLVCHELR